MREPPQKEPELALGESCRDTMKGNSPGLASTPPTILLVEREALKMLFLALVRHDGGMGPGADVGLDPPPSPPQSKGLMFGQVASKSLEQQSPSKESHCSVSTQSHVKQEPNSSQ
jgi:hypothetical protein